MLLTGEQMMDDILTVLFSQVHSCQENRSDATLLLFHKLWSPGGPAQPNRLDELNFADFAFHLEVYTPSEYACCREIRSNVAMTL